MDVFHIESHQKFIYYNNHQLDSSYTVILFIHTYKDFIYLL